VPPVDLEETPKVRERGSRRRTKALHTQEGVEKEGKQISDTDTKVMIRSQTVLGCVVGFLSPHFCFLTFSVSLVLHPFTFFFLFRVL